MAKSKLDKLLEAIEAAEKIKNEMVIGEDPGQSKKESFDKFVDAIETAGAVAAVTDNEPAVFDEALNNLIAAVKGFKESANQDTESEDKEQHHETVVESEMPSLELKEVILKGWVDGKKGTHSIHLKNRIVSFVDGRSELSPELAEELQKAGYIE
ncbi:hypothetical protein [Paenibacillus sp.]|jgi:hypothetical protein|uniref:hypothetical protein n=1 Tax=Paenibacillus sp. TaxID=58172 RepID=UPI0028232F3E|nr:hypothetical protein [Paenibacillus sp.]MDR0269635.1 hypothetical protein [Paenibacillus sp.]